MRCRRRLPRLRTSCVLSRRAPAGARDLRMDRRVRANWPLTIALAALASATAAADTPAGEVISGRVVDVVSGDTLVVADGARRVEVRLADIDAPQGSDYYAPGARTLLAAMVRKLPV